VELEHFTIARTLQLFERGDLNATSLCQACLDQINSIDRSGPTLRSVLELTPDALTPAAVEGPICESTDSLGIHDLPALRRGDLVAIADAGAYAASQSSAYNGRPRPPQVLLQADGSLMLGRRRGSRVG